MDWCCQTAFVFFSALLIFFIGDYLLKWFGPSDVNWNLLKAIPANGPSFANVWLGFVGATIILSLFGLVATTFAMVELFKLNAKRQVFVIMLVIPSSLAIYYETQLSNGPQPLYAFLGRDLFRYALAGSTIGFGHEARPAFVVFNELYSSFTALAATLSTIIIGAFSCALPSKDDSVTADTLKQCSTWLNRNFTYASLIVTIGIVQLFSWMKVPSFAFSTDNLSGYMAVVRTLILYYAALYVLILAVPILAVTFLLRRAGGASRTNLLSITSTQDWIVLGKFASPILAAFATGVIDRLIGN